MTRVKHRKRRIAVLHHAADRGRSLKHYAIASLIPVWEADGHEVVHLFGTARRPEADVLLVHVDVSVVPTEYLDFARHYPAALNATVRDIRKRAFSANLLQPGDAWDGPVIVKSDRNYGGVPESRHSLAGTLRRRVRALVHHATDYRVFGRLADVPGRIFANPEWVVERFIPETDGELYCLRMYQFCGDHHTCARFSAPDPIIRAQRIVHRVEVPVHPDVVALRSRLALDYGKLDYVVHGERAFVLDVNKTQGDGGVTETHALARRRERAMGIYSYFMD